MICLIFNKHTDVNKLSMLYIRHRVYGKYIHNKKCMFPEIGWARLFPDQKHLGVPDVNKIILTYNFLL